MTLDTRRHRTITVAKSMRAGVRVCLVSASLTLFGCIAQTGLPGPHVIFETPVGPVPLNYPPGLQPALPAPAQAVSRDGRYAGIAEVLSTNGGLCIKPLTISDFIVRGSSVRFGRFQGTIAADDGLQMLYDGDWIVGQFEGAVFRGQLSVHGPRDEPGCTYILNLERTGP